VQLTYKLNNINSSKGIDMNKFNGIVTHQTVSDEDFKKMMTVPIEDIDKYSNVKVDVVKNASALHSKMARSIADAVISNNDAGRLTKTILPVGPTPQYPILVGICNKEKINLKNLWIFFMDEYLDWEGRLVPRLTYKF